MSSIRTERLAAVIQRDLGYIIQQSYQKSGSFITITQVDVTPDLQLAKIFISIYAPGKDKDAIFSNLEEHKVGIRKELASKIRHQVRRIPELQFNKDESAEYVDKMENLFDQIREERKQRSTGEEE